VIKYQSVFPGGLPPDFEVFDYLCSMLLTGVPCAFLPKTATLVLAPASHVLSRYLEKYAVYSSAHHHHQNNPIDERIFVTATTALNST
jgi:hypothetical protein